MKSVLQDWVMKLPLRYQGTLLTGIRGCDLTPKNPVGIMEEDTAERGLTAYLRFLVMNPADPREVDVPGAFFQSKMPPHSSWKPSQFGHYPLHWFSHLMHCYEVCGHCHPYGGHMIAALSIYHRLAHSLHLNVETQAEMHARLTEDRLKNNTVVS